MSSSPHKPSFARQRLNYRNELFAPRTGMAVNMRAICFGLGVGGLTLGLSVGFAWSDWHLLATEAFSCMAMALIQVGAEEAGMALLNTAVGFAALDSARRIARIMLMIPALAFVVSTLVAVCQIVG